MMFKKLLDGLAAIQTYISGTLFLVIFSINTMEKSSILSVIPEIFISSPTKIKNGIAMREISDRPLTILLEIMDKGPFPVPSK